MRKIIPTILMTFLLCGCGMRTEENLGAKEIVVDASIMEEKESTKELLEEQYIEKDNKEFNTKYETIDRNVYGNAIGNIMNEGHFVAFDDGYIVTSLATGVPYMVDANGSKKRLTSTIYNVHADRLSIYHNLLLGVDYDNDEPEGILYIDLSKDEIEPLCDREFKPKELFVVNDFLYFTEFETNKLKRIDISGWPDGLRAADEQLVLDTKVFYPIFFNDYIVYQRDEDGESLYSHNTDTREDVKLTDVSSHYPFIYEGRVYYEEIITGDTDEEYESYLCSVNIDGTDNQRLMELNYECPLVVGDRVYVIDCNNPTMISYLDFKDIDKPELNTILVNEMIIDELSELIDARIPDVMTLKVIQNLSSINGDLYFNSILFANGDEDDLYVQSMMLDKNSEAITVFNTLYYDEVAVARQKEEKKSSSSEKSDINDGQIVEQQIVSNATTTQGNHNYYKNISQEQAAQADAVASQIANQIMSNPAYTSDLQRVQAAAQIVAGYSSSCSYGRDAAGYYRSPYGVFVAGVYTCAGSARALGRVLDFMGFSWKHANENQNAHQWCIVTMDGQIGFADGMGGFAGYGEETSGMNINGVNIYFR